MTAGTDGFVVMANTPVAAVHMTTTTNRDAFAIVPPVIVVFALRPVSVSPDVRRGASGTMCTSRDGRSFDRAPDRGVVRCRCAAGAETGKGSTVSTNSTGVEERKKKKILKSYELQISAHIRAVRNRKIYRLEWAAYGAETSLGETI